MSTGISGSYTLFRAAMSLLPNSSTCSGAKGALGAGAFGTTALRDVPDSAAPSASLRGEETWSGAPPSTATGEGFFNSGCSLPSVIRFLPHPHDVVRLSSHARPE